MPRDRRLVKLSKRLSYLLRHHPEKLDLELDARGFTTISVEEVGGRMGVSPRLIRRVVESDPRGRFTRRNGRIRANYGHSIPIGRAMLEGRPPASPRDLPPELYHGTREDRARRILKEGLKPMGREMVHLSTTREWAARVGRRHGGQPVILRVDVGCARERGVKMWPAGPATVLATEVPPECVALC